MVWFRDIYILCDDDKLDSSIGIIIVIVRLLLDFMRGVSPYSICRRNLVAKHDANGVVVWMH